MNLASAESEPAADPDGDGIGNGAEYFMGTPANSHTVNPSLISGVVTWPRAADAAIRSFKIEVSNDLVSWQDAAVAYPENVNIGTTQVSFALPEGAGKIFTRLNVTP